MRSLQKIFFLLLFTVFCAPGYAAISSVQLPSSSCSVFNEAEDDGDGEKDEKKEEEEDEEPDCE